MSILDIPWMTDIPKDDVTHMEGLGLRSNFDKLGRDRIFYYEIGFIEESVPKPILVLLHGFPQT